MCCVANDFFLSSSKVTNSWFTNGDSTNEIYKFRLMKKEVMFMIQPLFLPCRSGLLQIYYRHIVFFVCLFVFLFVFFFFFFFFIIN